MANPDIPPWLVHFTGRPASFANRSGIAPTMTPSQAAEARLNQILTGGVLKASRPHGAAFPAICMSELTQLAIEKQLRSGFTWKGPYAPWGLVLAKTAPEVASHARPVLYLSPDEMAATNALPPRLLDRRVESVPGVRNNDWTHEREWRICWGVDVENAGIALVPGTICFVIVGRSGWMPEGRGYHPSPIPRWLWNGAAIVDDGVI